jgi:hypothetical protein
MRISAWLSGRDREVVLRAGGYISKPRGEMHSAPELYQLLVGQRGWTPGRCEGFQTDTLAPPPAVRLSRRSSAGSGDCREVLRRRGGMLRKAHAQRRA